MARTRTRRGPTYRARELVKVGPRRAHYFRRYGVNLSRTKARGGLTSHGFRIVFPVLGPLTINLTRKTWTWDNPGPGSVSGSWGARRLP